MNKIFKYFTTDVPITVAYVSWFRDSFPESEFSGIDKVLYFFLGYCATLSIPCKRKYLLVFLTSDLRKLVRAHNIRVDSLTSNYNYDELAAFEQAVQVISTNTVDTYDSYCNTDIESDSVDDFKVLLRDFMQTNMSERLTSVFSEQFIKLSSGVDTLEIGDETIDSLNTVRDIYDLEKLDDLDFLVGASNGTSVDIVEDKARLIAKTGIPAVDEDYGGMFSKALITFAGQPGSGKTRFMLASFVYQALVVFKVGVRFDELELSTYEIKNILLSIHIAHLYKIKIPDRDMNRGDLNDEQKRIVESARIDLFESGKYGRFALVCNKDMYVEGLSSRMNRYFKLNRDIQLWCVDYIGRISSKPVTKYDKPMLEYKIIDESLKTIKNVARRADICAVCANQYNDEGNKAAFAGKPITVGHIMGGQATQRHSDYDIAITYTDDQKAANLRMISSTKDRASIGFQFVPLHTDLAISRWTQISSLEERG